MWPAILPWTIPGETIFFWLGRTNLWGNVFWWLYSDGGIPLPGRQNRYLVQKLVNAVHKVFTVLCFVRHIMKDLEVSEKKVMDGVKKNMLSLQRRHVAFFVCVRVCPLAASGITVQRESFFHRSKDTFWFQHSVALDVLPWKRNSSGWLVATLADEKCWWLISRCVNAITTLVLPHTKPRELHRSISPKTLE